MICSKKAINRYKTILEKPIANLTMFKKDIARTNNDGRLIVFLFFRVDVIIIIYLLHSKITYVYSDFLSFIIESFSVPFDRL